MEKFARKFSLSRVAVALSMCAPTAIHPQTLLDRCTQRYDNAVLIASSLYHYTCIA
jgi:hypothetical protein